MSSFHSSLQVVRVATAQTTAGSSRGAAGLIKDVLYSKNEPGGENVFPSSLMNHFWEVIKKLFSQSESVVPIDSKSVMSGLFPAVDGGSTVARGSADPSCPYLQNNETKRSNRTPIEPHAQHAPLPPHHLLHGVCLIIAGGSSLQGAEIGSAGGFSLLAWCCHGNTPAPPAGSDDGRGCD